MAWPPYMVVLGDHFTRFSGHRNYPQGSYTRPRTSIILWYRSAADGRTSMPRASHNSCVSSSPHWFRTGTSATPAHRPYVGGLPRLPPRPRVGPGDIVQRDGRAD